MEKQRTIVVPWDFTEKAEFAVSHAVKLAQLANETITLLNIVKKEKEVEESTTKLQEVADNIEKQYGIKPEVIAREGSIFDTINDVCHELEARLVVMGTHGMRGMQKLTGSWALKVIAKSKIPFIVVQKPMEKDYSKVLFPVDFTKESKEKVKWAVYMAKFFSLKMILFTYKSSLNEMKGKTTANLKFAKNYLAEHNIDYEIKKSEGKKKFWEETILAAKEENADMIITMTTKDIGISNYMFGANEQQIIANEEGITVMCINPRSDLYKTSALGSFDI